MRCKSDGEEIWDNEGDTDAKLSAVPIKEMGSRDKIRVPPRSGWR